MNLTHNLSSVRATIPKGVTLIAVSKTKPNFFIEEAYQVGQRHFGENKVQELVDKHEALPKDIYWHMIGHLQTNKVKYIAPFVHLIHGVDSVKLLLEINKRANQNNRVINCLLQIHIAQEETKFGFSNQDAINFLTSEEYHTLNNINIVGLMGMATNTENLEQVKAEFAVLKSLFDQLKLTSPMFSILSMGMSGDYKLAIEEGSNMVRVGSAIFGNRTYSAL